MTRLESKESGVQGASPEVVPEVAEVEAKPRAQAFRPTATEQLETQTTLASGTGFSASS